MTRDNFSQQAGAYAIFRPGYPDALYEFILANTAGRKCALDVATGNGQVAAILARNFEFVEAIDISEKQLQHAQRLPNVRYDIAFAENTGKENKKFDLVTVGQAAHWFDIEKFYDEVKRILVPGGTLALFGYRLPSIDSAVDEVLLEFYNDLLGTYWDPERKLVDEAYEKIYYPFNKIPVPDCSSDYSWSFDQFIGFLSTWSAVQHYKNRNQSDPLELFIEKFRNVWKADTMKKISFPFFLLLTRI